MPSKSREFAAYVPRLIFRNARHTNAPPTDGEGDSLPAVALFADVAGSTVLANQLAKLGRMVGPEEMCRILNAYYEPLISLLQARGGDVVGFAGDAVLAIWPAPAGDDLGPAVRQATQAALEIQRDLNNLELAPGVRLSLRICIGAGELATALVGGRQGFWQLIAYGPPLDQIRDAGDTIRIGGVYLSPEAAALLGPGAEVERVPGGGAFARRISAPLPPPPGPALPDLTSLPDNVLRPYVPRAVQEGIDAGAGDFLAQARTVSSLFVRIFRPAGATPHWERIQEAMAVLQDAMGRYEGTVAQLMEDDKGLIAVLAFGLPPAHEDDAGRAVAAAGLLRDLARKHGVSCGIGVSTGLPFCAPLGGPGRRVYTVTGADVIRAARLMQLARAGDILCDDPTRAAAAKGGPHRFTPLPRFHLKGFDAPVRVYRADPGGDPPRHPAGPLGRAPEPGAALLLERLRADRLGDRLTAHLRVAGDDPAAAERECDRLLAADRLVIDHGVCELIDGPATLSPADDPASRVLVGREAERAVFAAALDAAAGGPRVVVVEGDIGSGKSRLLAEALALAADRGVLGLVGSCSSVETATPYYPWRAVLEALLGLPGLPGPAERGARVLAALRDRPRLAPLAPLLNELLGLALPEDELLRQTTGQTRADALNDVIVGLLDATAAGRPVLVVLDDAQWADSSSWRLAKLVGERVGGIALALAVRQTETPLPAEYDLLVAAGGTDRIVLDPLPEAAARELARLRLGAGRLDDATAALVWSRAQGNPLFVEQVADHLAATGLVEVRDGSTVLRVAAGADTGIPTSLHGLVTARIDRLPPGHQVAAKVWSVIGPTFPWRAAAAVHPTPSAAELPAHAAGLTRERVLRQDRADPDPAYAFPHPVVQQVCYDLLTRPQRQRFHRAAAEWFEADAAAGGTTPDRLIAHHWGFAGDPDRQAQFLARAGEAAARDGAFREAVAGFTELLGLSRKRHGDSPPAAVVAARAHWEYRLGEAYFGVGELPAAADHLAAAVALHGRPLRSSAAGVGFDCVAQAAVQLVHRLSPARRRVPTAVAHTPGREVAAAYNRLGRVRYYMSEIMPGTNCVLRALNAGEAVGPSPELATAYAGAMILAGLLNWRRVARVYARLAETTTRAAGQMPNQSVVITYLCMHHLGLGEWDRVDALVHESLDYAERLRDHHQTGEALTVLAMLECFRADYPAALAAAARMIDASKRSGNAMHAAWAMNIQGECHMRLGHPEEAVSWLAASAAALVGNKDRTEEIRIEGMLAGLASRAGDRAAAAGHAAAAEAVAREVTAVTCSTLEGFAGVAEARFALAEADPAAAAARSAAAAALAALRRYARLFPPGEARAALYEGRARLLAGSPAKAVRAWRRGLASAVRLRMRFDAALMHDALGRHAPPGSPDRREHLGAAAELYAGLGMTADAERAAGEL